MVAHNAEFDMSFIRENAKRQQIQKEFTYVDTMGIARLLLPGQAKHTLDAVAKTLKISLENHHIAVDDAECTAEIFTKFIEMLKEKNVETLGDLHEITKSNPEIIKKMTTYHVIILAKNNGHPDGRYASEGRQRDLPAVRHDVRRRVRRPCLRHRHVPVRSGQRLRGFRAVFVRGVFHHGGRVRLPLAHGRRKGRKRQA